MKKNKIVFSGAIFILLVGLSLLGANFTNQFFDIVTEEVWMPRYWTAECVERTESMKLIQITDHDDDPVFYHCDNGDSNTYIPEVNGVQCVYTVSDFSTLTVYECEGYEDNRDNLGDCEELTSLLDTDPITFYINAGNSIYINSGALIGSAKLEAMYPAFGLRIESADGYVNAITNNCLLKGYNEQDLTGIDFDDRLPVTPGVAYNAVSGLEKVISTQVVTLNNVENGDMIYITRPGYYYTITDRDGFVFVDTRSGEKQSDLIECIPRTGACSDDAKIIKDIVGSPCDEYGGAITGYASVKGDATQVCRYACDEKTGLLVLTDDCIDVVTDCPPDKPLWDANTGECFALEDKNKGAPPEEKSYLNLILIIGGIIIVLLILVIILKAKK